MMNLSPFKLERFFAKYEFAAKYLLCSSDCQSYSVGELLALEPEASNRFQNQWLGYTETQGSPSLRKEISGLYETVSAENIIVHNGGEEGIFLAMHTLLEKDDHVIVHTPCYQSLTELAHSLGCRITEWSDRGKNGWGLDPEDLEEIIRPDTKAIIVNSPHNPTGSQMSKENFHRIHEIASKLGIVVLSDEAYREAEYRPEDRLPAACDANENAISLGVMSKAYGLPGLRIGWLATRNKNLFNKITLLKDYTTICNSAPSEFLAEVALRHRNVILHRNRELMNRNLDILDGFFGKHRDRFVWKRPQAGPIAFPELRGEEVAMFCDRLVNKTGVLLLPGTIYDDPGNNFRIGFGRTNMAEALGILEEFLHKDAHST
jgi:aspartate/methionine/tyrosine aminotransferase